MYLEPDEILDIARRGGELGCKEALFTLGDRPEERWPEARQWLDERGYDSTLDYVRAMAIRVLEETGLLPHLNPGVMSWSELSRLKPVAPSMGMMLETTSRRLFETKGEAHYGSPDKDPEVRLRTLTDAGRLSIPFTTGLLVGIGETLIERAETIHAIRKSHKEFGHVQEVIVQNFRAKDHTAMAVVARRRYRRLPGHHRGDAPGARPGDAHSGTAESGVARRVPGADRRGCRRLGWRVAADARSRQPGTAVARAGRSGRGDRRGGLRPGATPDRAAAVRAGRCGVDRSAGARARRCAGRSRHRVGPRRQPGRAAVAGTRRGHRVAGPHRSAHGDRHRRPAAPRPAAISTARSATGSRSARRSHELAARAPERIDTDVLAALRSPSAIRPAAATTSISRWRPRTVRHWKPLPPWRIRCVETSSATTSPSWSTATSTSPTSATPAAGSARSRSARATPTRSRCPPSEVADRAWEAHVDGATEVCMQGGIDPELPVTGYADLVRAVKARVPSMHVHAFSPMEIANGVTKSGLSIREWLISLREAGLGHHPRHRGGDPRRRGPLGADQGQAADVGVDRGRHHRPRGRSAVEFDDDVRPRRHPASTGSGTSTCCAASRTAPAGSPSSCRCRSCISARRCTWPAPRGRARRTATTERCMRWRGSCCTAGSPTSRPAGSSSASSAPR